MPHWIYKYFAVFLKTIHTEVHQRNLCKAENGNAAHISAIQVCFPSGLTPINTFCQLKSTEHYND